MSLIHLRQLLDDDPLRVFEFWKVWDLHWQLWVEAFFIFHLDDRLKNAALRLNMNCRWSLGVLAACIVNLFDGVVKSVPE